MNKPGLQQLARGGRFQFAPWHGLRWGGAVLVFIVGLAVLLHQAGAPYEPELARRVRPLRTVSVVGVWRPQDQTLRAAARAAEAQKAEALAREARRAAQLTRRSTIPAPVASGRGPSGGSKKQPSGQPRRVHTVSDGESLWVIARKHLGAGWRWEEIAAANPNVDPDRMREGTKLVIPAAATGSSAASSETAEKPTKKAPVKVRFHVVVDGETLSEIASRYYKDNDWTRIGRANGLSDPTKLRKGARLVIPPERS